MIAQCQSQPSLFRHANPCTAGPTVGFRCKHTKLRIKAERRHFECQDNGRDYAETYTLYDLYCPSCGKRWSGSSGMPQDLDDAFWKIRGWRP